MKQFLAKVKSGFIIFSIFAARVILRVFYIFPINQKKIVFSSFNGEQYSCSPYYIYQNIISRYPDVYKVYWHTRDKNQNHSMLNAKDTIIVQSTLPYFYHMLTSRFIIVNNSVHVILPIRNHQIVINTWHGGGLFKKINKTIESRKFVDTIIRRIHNQTNNLFLASSNAFEQVVIRKRFNYSGQVLETGLPRNDIFFTADTIDISTNVKKYFNIPPEGKIILYAPTYRGAWNSPSMNILKENTIDIPNLVKQLKHKTGNDYYFIFRGHHAFKDSICYDCIDATNYPDMQKLLVSTDIFITDYSSSLWDFSLTFKPCVMFIPDIENYLSDPGLETDYREWPFPSAKNNDELCYQILNFNNEDYKKNVLMYHQQYGSFENGCATEKVVEYIRNNGIIG